MPYVNIGEETEQIEFKNRTDSWETQHSKYHIKDIDLEIFKDYLQRAKDAGRISFRTTTPSEVMTKLELSDGDTLLNAGAALFVDSGINELQMAKFASDERLTFLDIKRYTGSIFALADKAVAYIADAMDWRVEFDGSLSRKEFPEVPVDAVREAVINAFGHRTIESMQAVEVAMYKSFIDIYSPGKFPDGVTPEQFITQALKPIRRNPLITRTLYYSKDMESFATGLKRIYEACTIAGVQVDFLMDEYGFTVRFHRHCGTGWNQTETKTGIQSATDSSNGTLNGTLKTKKATLKDLIRLNPKVTRKQMADALGICLRTVQRILNEMDDVYFTGGGRNGHWEIIESAMVKDDASGISPME